MKTSEQIKGLAHATGMANPMLRPDYRQGIRAGMLRDARRHLCQIIGAPARFEGLTMREWGEQATATRRRKLTERTER